ncbi:MAG TPA: hypothetical protein VGH23_21960 [Rhizomicrobium sp.]
MQWPGRKKQLANFDDDDEIDVSNFLERVPPQLDEELPVDHVGGSGKIAEAYIYLVRQT